MRWKFWVSVRSWKYKNISSKKLKISSNFRSRRFDFDESTPWNFKAISRKIFFFFFDRMWERKKEMKIHSTHKGNNFLQILFSAFLQ
jgi:hypothetical protein